MTSVSQRALGLATIVLLGFMAVGVKASTIMGELWQNQPGASANATLAQAAGLGTPDATFNSGAINYDSNASLNGYTPAGFLNNPTFMNTSGSFNANAILNNTYFYFTGSVYLNAGNNSFVVGHDDGLQLNIDTIGMVVNTPGPTAFTNTPFNVNAPTAGNYNFEMSYGECCGAPAELLWNINNVTVGSTPLPASALSGLVLLLGLGSFMAVRRLYNARGV